MWFHVKGFGLNLSACKWIPRSDHLKYLKTQCFASWLNSSCSRHRFAQRAHTQIHPGRQCQTVDFHHVPSKKTTKQVHQQLYPSHVPSSLALLPIVTREKVPLELLEALIKHHKPLQGNSLPSSPKWYTTGFTGFLHVVPSRPKAYVPLVMQVETPGPGIAAFWWAMMGLQAARGEEYLNSIWEGDFWSILIYFGDFLQYLQHLPHVPNGLQLWCFTQAHYEP